MDCTVVCIARTAGSLGDEVAKIVAEKAGFRYIDEEVVLKAAQLGDMDVELVEDAEKRKSWIQRLVDGFGGGATGVEAMAMGAGAYVYAHGTNPERPLATEEDVRKHIREAIHDFAEAGRVVIVAHAASYALRADSKAMRVFITAPRALRISRLVDSGTEQRAAEKQVRESDDARADYLTRFYSVSHESPEHYDICINTDRTTPAQAAELILDCLKARSATLA
jgi:cytidylate kinase